MAVQLASIFFTMILVDNYVLVKFLGICPFLGVSKKLDSAVGMSLAVTFVMVLATAATWPIQMFLLTPPGSGLPPDHRLYPDHRHPGPAAGEHPEEVHPRPVQVPGRVPSSDHHQLHHPGRDHPEHRQRL